MYLEEHNKSRDRKIIYGVTNRLGKMDLQNFKLNLATTGHPWETPEIA
jgi:hypothetical protein